MLSRLIVQAQPMISMTLAGRNLQKMPIRHQIIRQFKNDSRETVTRAERISQRQTLKEKIMAPAGPNGKHKMVLLIVDILILSNNNNNSCVDYCFSICYRQRCTYWWFGTWFGCSMFLWSWHEQRCINHYE